MTSKDQKEPTKLDSPLGGLFLMICFTAMWTIIATYWIHGMDYYISTSILSIITVWLLLNYISFNRIKAKYPEKKSEPKQSEKWFIYVFAAEGLAILISRNVLINLGLSKYVLASFVLIVGLHFYPIGMIFKRTFDYFIATGLSAIAITGIILLHAGRQTENLINYGLSLASACVTIAYGSKMIFSCRRLIGQHPNTLKVYKSGFTDRSNL